MTEQTNARRVNFAAGQMPHASREVEARRNQLILWARRCGASLATTNQALRAAGLPTICTADQVAAEPARKLLTMRE